MYERHFGLTETPFRPNAGGAAVFVGPQQARVLTSLKKALSPSDSVIVVTGTVGVGKTTIVTRALETNNARQMVAWIGRMQLAADEVLELLLAGFGVSRRPNGTIQRFAAFKRLLNHWAREDARVVIVVEDATRVGNDALLELESLTAADTGDTSGANIVLMGPPEMNNLINTPALARLRQRSRLAQTINAFSAAEVKGYLKHCIRAAGAEYDAVFADDAADMVYRCSQGIPRVINNLSESTLLTAAEKKLDRINAALVRTVAAEVHGLEPALPASAPAPKEASAKPKKVARIDARPPVADPADARSQPTPEPEYAPESTPAPKPESGAKPTPEVTTSPKPEAKSEPTAKGENEPTAASDAASAPEPELPPSPVEDQFAEPKPRKRIPPLEMTGTDFYRPASGDTVREIPTLRPEAPDDNAASDADSAGKTEESNDKSIGHPLEVDIGSLPPGDPDELPGEELPVLSNSMRVDHPITENLKTPDEPPDVDAPASDPGPAAAHGEERAARVPDLDALEAAIAAAHKREGRPEKVTRDDGRPPLLEPDLQEITLDESLEAQRKKSEAELVKMAEELSRVESLEEMDDAMAETLFGAELEEAAAEALGNGPAEGTPAEGTPAEAAEEPSPVMLDKDAAMEAAMPAGGGQPVQSRPNQQLDDFDMSMSQRYSLVSALNDSATPTANGLPVEITLGKDEKGVPPQAPDAVNPDSFEEQIDTEITQTQKSVNVIPPPLPAPDADTDDEDKKSSTLRGIFRKSSRS